MAIARTDTETDILTQTETALAQETTCVPEKKVIASSDMEPEVYYQYISFLSCYPEIDEESLLTAIGYAIDKYPEETCGVVLRKREISTQKLSNKEALFLRCQNQAEDKYKDFKVNPYTVLGYRKTGALVGFYHSHTDQSECVFSAKDIVVQKCNNLPSFIIRVNEKKFINIAVIGGALWDTHGKK